MTTAPRRPVAETPTTRLSESSPGLAPPESGAGLMILGIGDEPRPARATRRVADRLTVTGEGLTGHEGDPATIIYIVEGTALLVGGRIEAPSGDGGEQTDIILTGPPRIVERRAAGRRSLRTIVRIDSEESDDPMFGISENLSATGVAVLCRRSLTVNTECRLTLTLPTGTEVRTGAHVVRSSRLADRTGHRIALMFADLREAGSMSEGEQEELRRALEEAPEEEGPTKPRVQSSYQRRLRGGRSRSR